MASKVPPSGGEGRFENELEGEYLSQERGRPHRKAMKEACCRQRLASASPGLSASLSLSQKVLGGQNR